MRNTAGHLVRKGREREISHALQLSSGVLIKTAAELSFGGEDFARELGYYYTAT